MNDRPTVLATNQITGVSAPPHSGWKKSGTCQATHIIPRIRLAVRGFRFISNLGRANPRQPGSSLPPAKSINIGTIIRYSHNGCAFEKSGCLPHNEYRANCKSMTPIGKKKAPSKYHIMLIRNLKVLRNPILSSTCRPCY